jgi:hypothetical protein
MKNYRLCDTKNCNHRIDLKNKSGYCRTCREKIKVKLPCANAPECDKMRIVTLDYALQKGHPNLTCPTCNIKLGNAKREEARLAKLDRRRNALSVIPVNDCLLVRADEGRCIAWEMCRHGAMAGLFVPREQDCGWLVALEDWPGFECQGGTHPGPLSGGELFEALKVERASVQSMALEC